MASSVRAELALLAGLAAACAGPGTGPVSVPLLAPDAASDQARYETCNDPEGTSLYDQAVKKVGERAPAEALDLLRRAVQRCPDLVRAHLLYQDTALELARTKGDPAPEKAM